MLSAIGCRRSESDRQAARPKEGDGDPSGLGTVAVGKQWASRC
jgi:hypothetical protein